MREHEAGTGALTPSGDAGAYLLTFGRHKGLTIAQVYNLLGGKSYVEWLAMNDGDSPAGRSANAAQAFLRCCGMSRSDNLAAWHEQVERGKAERASVPSSYEVQMPQRRKMERRRRVTPYTRTVRNSRAGTVPVEADSDDWREN